MRPFEAVLGRFSGKFCKVGNVEKNRFKNGGNLLKMAYIDVF